MVCVEVSLQGPQVFFQVTTCSNHLPSQHDDDGNDDNYGNDDIDDDDDISP